MLDSPSGFIELILCLPALLPEHRMLPDRPLQRLWPLVVQSWKNRRWFARTYVPAVPLLIPQEESVRALSLRKICTVNSQWLQAKQSKCLQENPGKSDTARPAEGRALRGGRIADRTLAGQNSVTMQEWEQVLRAGGRWPLLWRWF